MTSSDPARDVELLKRGLYLEYATLLWNVAGVVVTAVAAIHAQSVALAGFGLDSLIEIFASLVVVWQLTSADKMPDRRALKLIGASFGLLAIYLLVQIVVVVAWRVRPQPSELGLAWLTLTCVAMCALAWGKRITGRELGNVVLMSEAGVTLVDAALAATVLVGVGLNVWRGWWWADPLSGLAVLGYAAKEARAAFRHSQA